MDPINLAHQARHAAVMLPSAFLFGAVLLVGAWKLHRGPGWGFASGAMGVRYAAYWLAFAYGLAVAGDDRHLSIAVGLAVGVVALGVIPFVAVAVVAWAWGRRSERHWAKAARVGREPS